MWWKPTKLLVLVALLVLALPVFLAQADSDPDDAVERTWERTDLPVSELRVSRSWIWGPAQIGEPVFEPYADSPDGQRMVVYFDKSRMEVNDPTSDSTLLWYVTQGHLARELMTGEIQVADDQFELEEPAWIHVAGDPDPNAATYATFGTLMDATPLELDSVILQTIDASGIAVEDDGLAAYNVTASHFFEETGHTIANVFNDFIHSTGLVYEDGQYIEGPIFESPLYAVGLPLTEAYWLRVDVDGQEQWVLTQCFERRCLTYTPDNPDGWKVETGNIGRHYYEWRYEDVLATPPPVAADSSYFGQLAAVLDDFSSSSAQVIELLNDPRLDSEWHQAFEAEMDVWKSFHPRMEELGPSSTGGSFHADTTRAFELIALAADDYSVGLATSDRERLDRVGERLSEANGLLPFGGRWTDAMEGSDED